jgi:hypothetical protein
MHGYLNIKYQLTCPTQITPHLYIFLLVWPSRYNKVIVETRAALNIAKKIVVTPLMVAAQSVTIYCPQILLLSSY